MQIRDLLMEKQRKSFVGRLEELDLLHQMLEDEHLDWSLVHFYGPGGIGKTTLLRLFAEQIDKERCMYIDQNNGFTDPAGLLHLLYRRLLQESNSYELDPVFLSVAEITQLINHYAISKRGFLILFDTFERWGSMEDWLREQWLPSLHPLVKICTAGRHPLSGAWQRGGWNQLTQNVKLQPLTIHEVAHYAHSCGIDNPSVIQSLTRFSGGIPLALSMACEIIVRNHNVHFLSNPEQTQIIGTLISELMQDIKNPAFQKYLEAAGVVWRFDQELLQAILQEEIPTHSFREFCKLPFIILNEESWLLHDSIRQWTYVDLLSRQPNTYQLYRRRALEFLLQREQQDSSKKIELAMDKLFLHEKDLVRGLYFSIEEEISVREFKTEELHELVSFYQNYLDYISPNDSEVHYFTKLIPLLWEADPTSIVGMWRENELITFCTCIPLRDDTVHILRSSPLIAPAISKYDPTVPQYLICMSGHQVHMEDEISGTVARAFIQLLNKKAMITVLIGFQKWFDFLPILGFERASWGDTISANGFIHQGFQLDLRTEDYNTIVDRFFSTTIDRATIPSNEQKLSLKQTEELIRKVLKHFSHLHLYPELIAPLRSLLQIAQADHDSEKVLLEIQRQIQSKLDLLMKGTEGDLLLGQIIQYAYIKKIGPHERIAERFNISVPTYYRYLKRAIHKLAYELFVKTSNLEGNESIY